MNPNHYKKQCERALKRKIELIAYKGGCCEKCGYDKNVAALDFHHLNPNEKSFQLDARHLSNTHIDKLKQEANKCILVCANCHREIHNSKYDKNNIDNLLMECKSENVSVYGKKKKTTVCPVCGKEFFYVKGKKYCSSECRLKSKNYPSYEEIIETYQNLKSWEKVACKYNLTRKIIRNIVKRK